jgi:hypothetical protein
MTRVTEDWLKGTEEWAEATDLREDAITFLQARLKTLLKAYRELEKKEKAT